MTKTGYAFIISLAMATAVQAQSVIVQWGESGGDTAIVTANQLTTLIPTTYTAGATISPTVGADYYSSATTNITPVYNGAFDANASVVRVLNGASTDQIQGGAASGTSIQGMFVWEADNFTTPIALLQSLSLEAYKSSADSGVFRFLLQASDNSWYASEQTTLGNGFPASASTLSDVTVATWFAFTPFSGGTATIGGASTPASFDKVKAVGVYYDLTRSTGTAIFAARYFQATGLPGSSKKVKLIGYHN